MDTKTKKLITLKELSKEQKDAYHQIMEFVKSKPEPTDLMARQFCLCGYAGTGKTSLLNVILREFKKKHIRATCTAPTNEALRVISRLTGQTFRKTIYGLLGLMLVEDDDTGPRIVPAKDEHNSFRTYEVIVIDETSMIKTEIWQAIQENMYLCEYVKVIYIGDNIQLPPVGEELKESITFNTENKAYLTTVQRTVQDNPIIELATKIRNNVESRFEPYDRDTKFIEENEEGVQFYDDNHQFINDLIEDFKSEAYQENSNYVRGVAFTNRLVNRMNELIREAIWGEAAKDEYVVGEKLLVDANVLHRHRSYGDIVYSVGERVIVKKCEKLQHKRFGVNFWKLRVTNFEEIQQDQQTYDLWVVASEHKEEFKSKIFKAAAKAKKMIADNPKANRKEAWELFFELKNSFNDVRYNYAITIHKSQGATFERTYVVQSDLNKCRDHLLRNKLRYTAFTRSSKLLRIL